MPRTGHPDQDNLLRERMLLQKIERDFPGVIDKFIKDFGGRWSRQERIELMQKTLELLDTPEEHLALTNGLIGGVENIQKEGEQFIEFMEKYDLDSTDIQNLTPQKLAEAMAKYGEEQRPNTEPDPRFLERVKEQLSGTR